MFGEKETTLKAFVDGFGGMAVTDVSDTDDVIKQFLNDESPWDLIDGLEKQPKGHYLVTIVHWIEGGCPDMPEELLVEMDKFEKIEIN